MSGSTGLLPRRSWSSGLQITGELAKAGFGTGCGEGEADARVGFDDAGAELEEPEPQRGELSFAEMMGCGTASRRVSISQYAAACRTRRTWLAVGERQLVRSEASWLLCILIRFSAWPRAL